MAGRTYASEAGSSGLTPWDGRITSATTRAPRPHWVTGAQLLLDQCGGDLRQLRDHADGDTDTLRRLLRDVPRLGPVGVDMRVQLDRSLADQVRRQGCWLLLCRDR